MANASVSVLQHNFYTQNHRSGLEDIANFGRIEGLTGDDVSTTTTNNLRSGPGIRGWSEPFAPNLRFP